MPQPSPTPSIVFSGNDGGLDKSTDGGATWTALNSGGLQTGLFYNIDVKPDATGSVTVGALQDNEIETTKGAASPGWISHPRRRRLGCRIRRNAAGQVYGDQRLLVPGAVHAGIRSTNDGATFPVRTSRHGAPPVDAGCYLAPVTTDPSNGSIVYVSGSQNLWQSQERRQHVAHTVAVQRRPATSMWPPTNGNNVVIAVGNQVFVSTNALAATVGPPPA